MHDLQSIELFVPPHAKDAIQNANKAMLVAYQAFRGVNDPAAPMLFGMTAEEFAVAQNLKHSEVLQLASMGLPLWTKRMEMKLVNPDATGALAQIDRDVVVRTLLKSYASFNPSR